MSIFDTLWDYATDFAHSITGIPTAKQKRDQQRMINDQIKAYQNQTEITKEAIAEKKNAELAEKRRIEEKQIRALRRNYRAPGFLGTTSSSEPDMSTQLGG